MVAGTCTPNRSQTSLPNKALPIVWAALLRNLAVKGIRLPRNLIQDTYCLGNVANACFYVDIRVSKFLAPNTEYCLFRHPHNIPHNSRPRKLLHMHWPLQEHG
jgi:hypothetical protein